MPPAKAKRPRLSKYFENWESGENAVLEIPHTMTMKARRLEASPLLRYFSQFVVSGIRGVVEALIEEFVVVVVVDVSAAGVTPTFIR